MKLNDRAIGLAILAFAAASLAPATAFGHCDGMDGPVVTAARRALEAGDVKPVLIWVQEKDEAEITGAFKRTLAVRRLGSEAKELADRYFFETLVRVHRAGEGAPYTGLAPAGRDLGPAIPAADRALESGDPGALSAVLDRAVRAGLAERFQRALDARRQAGASVAAGRTYVAAYVTFIHYVEDLYQSATREAHGHVEEESQAPAHAH